MALYSPGGLNLADTTAPLILAYDDTGTTDVVFAVSASGDLTITPDGTKITIGGRLVFPTNGRIVAGATSWGVLNAAASQNNLHITDAGIVSINDSANANMTIGLTINQGANNNEILALKSSDVAHGMTTNLETDTFARFMKASGVGGGLKMTGVTDGDGAAGDAIDLEGFLGEAADTTKTSAALGVISLNAYVKSGNTVTVVGTDGNLAVITNGTSARFIFDADGDSHQDVGTAWTNFDDVDDALMTRSLAIVMDRASIIKTKWDDFGRDHLEDVIACGLIPRLTPAQLERGESGLVNMTQHARLLNGVAWQHEVAIRDARSRQESIEDCLRFLVEQNPEFTGRTEALALLEAA